MTDDENGKVDVNSLIEEIKLAIDEKVNIISISVGMIIDNDSLDIFLKRVKLGLELLMNGLQYKDRLQTIRFY